MSYVYIAGPIKGQPYDGVRNAVKAADEVLASGHIPFVPHLSCLWAMISGDKKSEDWLVMDFAWILACDSLIRLPGESLGSDAEVDYALELGMPVYFSVEEWRRSL